MDLKTVMIAIEYQSCSSLFQFSKEGTELVGAPAHA